MATIDDEVNVAVRQVDKGRLEPLKRTYLENGIRTGDINDVEAQAIVEAIAACHDDPAYEDRDFGVICLQGDMQGERIEQLLLDRLGHDVFTKRRLRCGNPYAFQGDERDVMFLSMVAAPNRQQKPTPARLVIRDAELTSSLSATDRSRRADRLDLAD